MSQAVDVLKIAQKLSMRKNTIILICELWRATPTEKKNKNVEFERTTVDSFRFTHSTKTKRFILSFHSRI